MFWPCLYFRVVMKIIYPQFFKDKLAFSKETISQWEGVNVFFLTLGKPWPYILIQFTGFEPWISFLHFIPEIGMRSGLIEFSIPLRTYVFFSLGKVAASSSPQMQSWASVDSSLGPSELVLTSWVKAVAQDSPHVTSSDGLGQWAPAYWNSSTPLSHSTKSTLCRGHPTLSYL